MTERALTPAQRAQSLAATIVAMGVTSAIYSLSLPLFSSRLDEMGHSEAMIGANAAAQSVALLAVAPFTPALLRRFGAARPMLWGFAATLAIVLLCMLYENAWYWLVLRLLMGISTGVLWIAGEAWVNQVSEDHRRGRNLAAYGIAAAAGTMAGFAIVYVVGHGGQLPFLIVCAMVVLCMAAIASARRVAPSFAGQRPRPMLALFWLAPAPILANFAVAVTFGSLSTFMPVYGADIGMSHSDAVLMLVLLSAGGLLQYPVGWLADRVNRRLLALVVMVATVALFALTDAVFASALPPAFAWLWALAVGLGMMSLYTLGLTLLGERFRGAELGGATTVFQFAFNVGVVVGPLLAGYAMASFGPTGLPWTLVAIYGAVIAISVLLWARRPGGL